MSILIVDSGLSNLGSITRAIEECGGECYISSDPASIKDAERLILPGVGSFYDASKYLLDSGWHNAIRNFAADGLPILGICLGMQLLCSNSEEGGHSKGLDLIPGTVIKIDAGANKLRVPHVGWNEIRKTVDNIIIDNISSGTDFYFVHSYHVVPNDSSNIIATVEYGQDIVAIIGNNNIWGTQFHPEKSGKYGFQILKNFLNYSELS